MGSKTITMTLDAGSIQSAIAELRAYKAEFMRKVEELRKRVGERIRWSAEQGFKSAVVEDIAAVYADDGRPANYHEPNDVTVTVGDDGTVTTVIASGSQMLFIEFGAGITHNGGRAMAGSSLHPWGDDLGYLIGTYGEGHGSQRAWGFRVSNALVITRGTPAAMPMYKGWEEAIRTFDEIVKEVFG